MGSHPYYQTSIYFKKSHVDTDAGHYIELLDFKGNVGRILSVYHILIQTSVCF